MKIDRVDLIEVRIPIKGHFETSYSRAFDSHKLLLKFYTPNFTAYTECVAEPDLGYCYETVGTAREILKTFILPSVMGRSLSGPEDFWPICDRFRGHPMAKASVENALWILKSLELNLPLAKLLGSEKDRIVAGVSIGIQDTTEELVAEVGRKLALGYPKIKLKVKPGRDIECIAAVRKAFPEAMLMVDANNAYSLQDLAAIKAMDDFDLLMIEQPLDHEDILDHAALQPQIRTPIGLDESIISPYHARLAIELKACRIINIKQGRVAGLARARQIHDLCQANGIGVWCGGMFETGIGRALIVALAGLPNFIYPNDISASDRYYPRDVIDPEFALNPDGTISVPQAPGLGVEINEKVLESYTIAREAIRP